MFGKLPRLLVFDAPVGFLSDDADEEKEPRVSVEDRFFERETATTAR